MDSLRGTQGVVGAYNWGTSTASAPPALQQAEPLSAGRPQADQFQPTSLPSTVGLPLELPTGVPAEVPTWLPTVEVPTRGLTTELPSRNHVPLFLAGDQYDLPVESNSSPLASLRWGSALGVLAQLDEPSATEAVRAVDNQPRVSPFSDMHMVGPGNAQQFLGNPSALYLGM